MPETKKMKNEPPRVLEDFITHSSEEQEKVFQEYLARQKRETLITTAFSVGFVGIVLLMFVFSTSRLQYSLSALSAGGCVGHLFLWRNGTHGLPPLFGVVFLAGYAGAILAIGGFVWTLL